MNQEKAHNGIRNGYALNGKHALVVACISAIFGGSIGPVLLVKLGGDSVVAPDRYTGSEARVLTQRVEHLENDVLEHVERHPDEVNSFDRRITVLEIQYANILSNQNKILSKLDAL